MCIRGMFRLTLLALAVFVSGGAWGQSAYDKSGPTQFYNEAGAVLLLRTDDNGARFFDNKELQLGTSGSAVWVWDSADARLELRISGDILRATSSAVEIVPNTTISGDLTVVGTFSAPGLLSAGSSTTNRLAKWTGSTTLGDSGVSDDGSEVALVNGRTFLVQDTLSSGFVGVDALNVDGRAEFGVSGGPVLQARLNGTAVYQVEFQGGGVGDLHSFNSDTAVFADPKM